MIYLSLFWEFLKIGLFSFGGAYGAIPIIQECALRKGWMDEALFSAMLAISESTPGPIMVNSATYIGNQQGGLFGAFLATFAVVLPAFVIILLITMWLKRTLENRFVQAVLQGIAPSLIGVIFATGLYMLVSGTVSFANGSVDFFALIIFVCLLAAIILYRKIFSKKLSPILLIVISAVLGILFYR